MLFAVIAIGFFLLASLADNGVGRIAFVVAGSAFLVMAMLVAPYEQVF